MPAVGLAQHQLDASGLTCPEPVMLLHRVIRQARAQDIVHVIATDPSTQRDIPKFCNFLGHELMEQIHQQERFEYWIRKGGQDKA